MTDMRWEDPPPSQSSSSYQTRQRRAQEVANLQANPGVWALVNSAAKSPGGVSSWQSRGAQTQTRKNPDGTWRIYARWPQTQAGDEPR